jgi:DNA protecting protein DprA
MTTRKSSKQPTAEINAPITGEVEKSVGISVDDLNDLYVLGSLKGFGPQKFKSLYLAGRSPAEVISNPKLLPIPGMLGERFRNELKNLATELRGLCRERATKQIRAAHKHKGHIITYSHPLYPPNVYASNNPIAVLYVRGAVNILNERQVVACVGSRKTQAPYSDLLRSFATAASKGGFAIVSGFALGADILAHQTAVATSGSTICVMPSGLDRPFPPENKGVWEYFLTSARAVFVTEFPFGSRASTLNLRKRNKLIVAFCRGVLIAQSAKDGGAMNAYRFAREQRKPVATFVGNSLVETSGNELIISQSVERDAAFSLTPDEPSYKQWLRALFSST